AVGGVHHDVVVPGAAIPGSHLAVGQSQDGRAPVVGDEDVVADIHLRVRRERGNGVPPGRVDCIVVQLQAAGTVVHVEGVAFAPDEAVPDGDAVGAAAEAVVGIPTVSRPGSIP